MARSDPSWCANVGGCARNDRLRGHAAGVVMIKTDDVQLVRDSTRWVAPLVVASGAIVTGFLVGSFGPVVAVAPFVAIATVWVWLRMPGVLLGTYLFLPFYKAALGPLSPIDLTPLLAVASASQLVLVLRARKPYRGSRIGLALWAVLGLVVLAGVTWAGQQDLALDRASFWWALILLPSIASVLVASDTRFITQFLATGFVIGTIIVLLGVPNLFGLARLSTIGENTLQTGAITLMVALLTIFWLLRIVPRWARPFGAALVAVALVESVASGSRGPLIAFVIALCYGFLRRVISGRPISRHDIGLAAVAACAVASLAVAVSRLPSQSIARILLLGGAVGSVGQIGGVIGVRVDLFSLAMQMFLDRPLLGNGTGAFAAYTTTHVGLNQYTYPHNDLLQVAAEFGIVGVGLVVVLAMIALFRRLPAGGAWSSARVLFVFMLVLSLSSGDIYGDRFLWGLLVILICSSASSDEAKGYPVGAVTRTVAPMSIRVGTRDDPGHPLPAGFGRHENVQTKPELRTQR